MLVVAAVVSLFACWHDRLQRLHTSWLCVGRRSTFFAVLLAAIDVAAAVLAAAGFTAGAAVAQQRFGLSEAGLAQLGPPSVGAVLGPVLWRFVPRWRKNEPVIGVHELERLKRPWETRLSECLAHDRVLWCQALGSWAHKSRRSPNTEAQLMLKIVGERLELSADDRKGLAGEIAAIADGAGSRAEKLGDLYTLAHRARISVVADRARERRAEEVNRERYAHGRLPVRLWLRWHFFRMLQR